MRLAALFLASARGAAAALAAPALEPVLQRLLDRGRSTWPSVVLDEALFVRHLAERAPTDADVLSALEATHAEDLYLACACAHGEAQALTLFERTFMAHVSDYLARGKPTSSFVDEVKQSLRHRLLLADPDKGGLPKIAGYNGQGPLGGWLRMTATRVAVNLHNQQLRPDAPVELMVDPRSPDPELTYLKVRYRHELQAALRATLEALPARDATFLSLYYVDGASSEAIAALYGISERTTQRRLAEIRERILDAARLRLGDRLGLPSGELDSVLDLARSELQLSLHVLLRRDGRTRP